ncbi:CDP-alcohol phosphatidyltransferase family protein [Candidatus Bathyarchaeota archaeon]|nr:CDP-alcohol phosphatidyltransferase family protein [Candidatus Bathyarchaeota archaeon]
MLTRIKVRFQVWVAGVAGFAHKMGLSPNTVSIIGIVFAVVSALMYSVWRISTVLVPFAGLLLLLSGFCDALDGVLAEKWGKTTVFGAFLDSTLDRYSDALVICGIIIGGLCNILWGLAALIGSFLVSYTRARGEASGMKMISIGLAERAERIIILAAVSFLFLVNADAVNYGVILLAVLANLSVLQRILYARKMLNH